MKIFQLTQKNFATIGISPILSYQSWSLNAEILIGFSITTVSFICTLVFAFSEAKTFIEYTQSIYIGSCAVIVILALVVIVFNVKKFFQLINDCENITNTSKYEISSSIDSTIQLILMKNKMFSLALKFSASTSIFNQAFRFERKLSGIIYFVMLKVTPICVFVPWTIYTFFIYFTTDLGNAAFQLPLTIWYV